MHGSLEYVYKAFDVVLQRYAAVNVLPDAGNNADSTPAVSYEELWL